MLFVGTKKQARDTVKDVAEAADMPFVNHRWLGGLLTNFQTINQRIRRLHDLERFEAEGQLALLPTRERMAAQADLEKLRANLGGVKNMQRVPDAMFVIDLKTELIAVKEAQRLRIPIIGLVDTNCDPDGIDFVVPGNDDAIRSCALITQAIGQVVSEGHSDLPRRGGARPQGSRRAGPPRGRGPRPPRGRGTGRARGRGAGRQGGRGEGGRRGRQQPTARPPQAAAAAAGGRDRAAAAAAPRAAPAAAPQRRGRAAAPSPAHADAGRAPTAAEAPPQPTSAPPAAGAEPAGGRGAAEPAAEPAPRRGRAAGARRGGARRGRRPSSPPSRRPRRPRSRSRDQHRADDSGDEQLMSTVEIAAKDVKALRERTGAGMMDCKKALTEAEGDIEKAIEILRVKQGKKIQDLGERAATEGTVQAYVHAGSKVGVLIEVDCNTDFVAKNDDFVGLRPRGRDADRRHARRSSTSAARRFPQELREAEARIYEQEAADKPENVREKIVSGKLDSWLSTIVLLEQEMHNPKFDGKTVQQLRDELTATTGENVVIRRFARFAVGQ